MNDLRVFAVKIPVDLARRVKSKAALEGIKLQDLAVRLFTEYLKEKNKGE